jgi:hypothetical protein
MKRNSDAVDDVLAAFSDHLEHGTPRPGLDHLDSRDRRLVEDLMRLMEAGQWVDPSASAPSLEALLAGTEFADALPPVVPPVEAPILHRMQDLLTDVDPRAETHIDDKGFLSFGYLDVLAQFHPLDTDDPSLPESALRALFDADSNVDLLALVAVRTDELLTRVITRYDVDPTVSTAAHRPVSPVPAVLPLALAGRAILEASAPEWGEFGLDHAAPDLVDVGAVELDVATRVLAEEAKRRYQGDKAVAYRSLVGNERRLVELITTATRPGKPVDLAAAVDHLIRQVA